MAGPLDEVGDYGGYEEPPPPPPPPPPPLPLPMQPAVVPEAGPDQTVQPQPESQSFQQAAPVQQQAPVDRPMFTGFEDQQAAAPPPPAPIPDTSGYDERQIAIQSKIAQLQKTQEGVHPHYWIQGLKNQQAELAAESKGIDLQRRAEMNSARQAAQRVQQAEHQNRLRATDLAARGIPTYRDSQGGLGVATDETGAPLSHLDKSHGIAYDSKGEPKSLEYGAAGAPQLKDPFADLPTRTDPKTGDQYQIAKGLPWKWVGEDKALKSQRMQEAKDKAVAKEAQLLGQKLSIDQADFVAGNKEHELMRKELIQSVPSLQDPKLAGADRETVMKAIDDHFNTEYGAPEANETNGWFSKDLAPSAQALRGDIDKRKAEAMDTAGNLFDLKDHQRALGESIQSERDLRKAEIETEIAHQRGQQGPLDQPPPQAEQPLDQGQTVPAPGIHTKDIDYTNPDAVRQSAQAGHIPPEAAPAAVAASHDIQDANAKADALQATNPTAADEYRDFAARIANGIANGVRDIVQGGIKVANRYSPLGLAKQVVGFDQSTDDKLANKTGDLAHDAILSSIRSTPGALISKTISGHEITELDDRLKDTVGAKVGNFIGGAVPYVATSLLAPEVGVPLTVSTLFSSGFNNTYEGAKARGVSDEKAQALGLASGAINGILGLPFKGAASAITRAFGGTAPKVIAEAVVKSFTDGVVVNGERLVGREGFNAYLKHLAEGVRIGVMPQAVKTEAMEGIQQLGKELYKTTAERALDVGKTALGHAAIGGGVQTAQNIVTKQYDPETGLFENVPEQALGFGVLGGVSKGFEQVARAREAKQALDSLHRQAGPPPPVPPSLGGPAGPKPPPVPPEMGGPAAPEAPVEPEKPAKAKVIEGGPDVSTEPKQETPPTDEPPRGGGPTTEPVVPDGGGAAPATPEVTQTGPKPATTLDPQAQADLDAALGGLPTDEAPAHPTDTGAVAGTTGAGTDTGAAASDHPAAGESVPADVEHKVEHGEHAKPGYTAVDTDQLPKAEAPKQGEFQPSETVKEAEGRLWRLTRDSNPHLLRSLQQQFGGHANYQDILDAHIEKHAEQATGAGAFEFGDTIHIGQTPYKVVGSDAQTTHIQSTEGGRLKQPLIQSTEDLRRNINSGHFGLDPIARQEQAPTSETAAAESPTPTGTTAPAAGAAGTEGAGGEVAARPEYTRSALKPLRKRSGIEQSPDVSTPQAVKAHLNRLFGQNEGTLTKTGTLVAFEPHDSASGFQTDPVSGKVSIDTEKAASHIPKIEEHGGSGAGWLTSSAQEEHWHAQQVKAAKSGDKPDYAGFHNNLDEETKKALGQAYPDVTDPAALGFEYERMVLQHRAGETITEAHHRDISAVLPSITGPQSEALESNISKILQAAEPQPEQPDKEVATVDEAAGQAAPEAATEAQLEAGNYQKGHIAQLGGAGGLEVAIENAAGSKRHPDFPPLHSHYGYIKGTKGADKDHVDVFIKEGTPMDWKGPVYVIDQTKPDGKFDEHKVVIGVDKPIDAIHEYQQNYDASHKDNYKGITEFKNIQDFKNEFAPFAQKGPAVLSPAEEATFKPGGEKIDNAYYYRRPGAITEPRGGTVQHYYKRYVAKERPDLSRDQQTALANALIEQWDETGKIPEVPKTGTLTPKGPKKQRVGTPEWALAKAPALNSAGKLPEMKRNARKAMAGDIRVTADRMKQAGMIGTKEEQVILSLLRKDFPTQLALEQAARTIARHSKGVTDASQEPSTEGVGVRGEGGEVGEGAPHGQSGQATGAGEAEEEEKPESAGPSGGVPTLEQLRAKLREQEKAGAVDDRLLQQIRELESEQKPKKPVTPQVPAMGGMTPLGVPKKVEGIKPVTLDEQARKDLGDALEGLMASAPRWPTKSPKMDEVYYRITEQGQSVEQVARRTGMKPRGVEAILAAMTKPLMASAPFAQRDIPDEKLDAFVKAAKSMLRSGVTTPEALAEVMPPASYPYLQAMWDAFGMVKGSLRGTHDWPKIVEGLKAQTAPAIEEAAPEEAPEPEVGARVKVVVKGETHVGLVQISAGLKWVEVKNHAPITMDEISSIEQLQTNEEVRAEKQARKLGKIIYTQPKTRDEYEETLWMLAAAVSDHSLASRGEYDREKAVRGWQLDAQFNKVADEIQLAKSKRVYMYSQAENRRDGKPMKRAHRLSSPYVEYRVPKPQDFDPDPKIRAKRWPRPLLDYMTKEEVEKSLESARNQLKGKPTKIAAKMAQNIIDERERQLRLGNYLEAAEERAKAQAPEPEEEEATIIEPEEETTEGTRITWSTPKEWIDGFATLHERDRHPSAKSHRDIEQHVEQLSEQPRGFFESATRHELEQIRDSLKLHNLTPPHGQRAGTPYERIINEVNNALAKPEKKPATVFLSGAQKSIADIDASIAANKPFGATVVTSVKEGTTLSQTVRRKIVDYVQRGGKVFLDSGAIQAFKANLRGEKVEVPWERVLHAYREIAALAGQESGPRQGQLYIVVPDVVGDAEATKSLQTKYASTINELFKAGFNLIFPVQKAPGVDLFDAVRQAVPANPHPDMRGDVIVGIPFNAKAWTKAEVLEWLDRQKGRKLALGVHLLGGGEADVNWFKEEAAKRDVSFREITGDTSTTEQNRVRKYGERKPKTVGSWKAQLDDGSGFADNRLRFATKEEAEASGRAIFNRWMGAKDMRVVESDEPVTHTWDKESGKPVEVAKAGGAMPKGHEEVRNAVATKLLIGQPFPRTELTELAEKHGLTAKQADEAAEAGIVQAATDMQASRRSATPQEIFDRLVEMYKNQPNLTARTATSKLDQAYSTPVPLAYVASQLADIKGGKKIYEPTAGNGMLLIEADPTSQQVFANELNDQRAAELMSQKIKVVTMKDASEWHPNIKADREVMNPPFGTVMEKGGNKTFIVDGVTTTQLDHAIVLESLKSLADDGRAVLIVGGPGTNTGAIMEEKNRKEFYSQGQRGAFWKRLYEAYGVIDHFTLDGELYKKQGAGWPVDVVLIRGRGKSPIQLPSGKAPRILTSWDDLRNELARTDAERITAGTLTPEQAAEQISGAISKIGDVTKPRGRPERAGHEPPSEAGAGPATDVEGAGKPAGELSVPSERGGHEAGGATAGGPAGGTGAGRAGSESEQSGRLDQAKEDLDNLLGGLMASEPFPEPLVQEDMPEEKTTALLKAARSMIAAGVVTPEKLAEMVPAPAHKYLQAIWDAMGMVKKDLRATHDWPKIVAGLKPQHPPEGQPPTLGVQGQSFPEPTPQFRVRYKPRSKHKSLVEDGVFTPTNLELAQRQALEKLFEKEDIDDFVMRKIGYQPHEKAKFTGEYFAAEQIDALALAIKATEKYDEPLAFILGDQGGIGKGRVAAGMILYAIQRGWIPAFFTKDIKLYAAMLNDFVDIGRSNLVPLITNNGISFKDEAGRTWKTKSGKAQRAIFEAIRDTRQLPKGIDVLFSSYSQVEKDLPSGYRHPSRQIRASMHARRQPPPDGFRMEALRAIAPNTFFILDESHLASGDSMTAWRMAPLLTASKATYYSSATFAKRPDNIGIYFKTTLSRAAGDMQHLIEAMQIGGVPLQQAVVAMLAEDGLYLRRERDFGKSVYRTHINIDTEERDRGLADTYTSGLRRILAVSNDIKDITDALNDLLGQQGTRLGLPSAPNLSSTNFSSIIHNLVSQYLLSIKTKSTVERALYHIEGGPPPEDGTDPERQRRRVVVTVQNTMESAIRALERGNYEKSFKGLLRRYLDKQRTLTSGSGPTAEEFYISDKPDPNFEGQSDQQLISQMMTVITNAEGQREAVFNRPVIEEYFRRQASALIATVADYIETLELGDMPLSPIDYMRQAIEEAGYKTVEITGRKKGMRKDGTIFDISEAENSKKAQLEYMDQFNNGDAWFLIMNDSGSTGISLQSKKTFKNLQQRAMLIAQPHLAIDKFMQSLWRIDRTGQVHPPFFELIQTAIPAEKRPAAVLERKMASLNANTTSNAKNEMKKQDLDIFNQYGDEKVWEYLRDDMDFTRMLDMDAKLLDRRGNLRPLEGLDFENGQLVAAVTGRLAILPVVQGDSFWDRVNSEYATFIEYLTATGQNTLIVSTIDMKAETLEKTEYTPGNPTPISAFDGPSVLEKVKGQMGKAPRHGNDVLLETGRVAREETAQLQAEWRTAQRIFFDAEERRRITLEAENLTPGEEVEAEKFPSKEDYVRSLRGDADKLKNWRERMRNARNLIDNSLRLLGDTIHIHNARGLDVYGGVVKAKLDLEKPLTPSAQQFTVWVNSTMRQIVMAATQLATDAVHFDREHFVDAYEENAQRSNEFYIITGNLLAASVNMGQVQNARIITYTDNKGDLRQGILMPVAWNPHTAQGLEAVTDHQHFRQLLEDGKTIVSRNQSLMVHRRAAGVYEIRMPAGRSTGGRWWGDSTLRGMMNGSNFEQKGSNFVGKFPPSRAEMVFNRITGEDPALATPLFFNRPVTPGGNPQPPIMASKPDDPRAVKTSAYRDPKGVIHEAGYREPHWKLLDRLGYDILTTEGVGYVSNEGEFLTRKQAWKRGQERGQLGKGPVEELESRDISFGPPLTYAEEVAADKANAAKLGPLIFRQKEPLRASVPAFARDYWTEDVRPLIKSVGATTKEILGAVANVLTPTYGVNKDVLDKVHGLMGDRNQVAYIVDRTGEAFEKMFNSMPRAELITFVDRVKQGDPQPTPELTEAADFIRKVDTASWEALTDAAVAAGMKNNPVAWLENHYRVMWKTIPNHPDTEGRRGGRSPLRGTRGMAKMHTLDTMSEGIDAGGIPFSYNPIVNLKMALADIWKYTTALKLWAWAKENGHATFVRGAFPKLPEGMTWLEDSIADVWFPAESGEGLVHGGKYAMDEGFGRLLNNFLSRDLIRQTKTGRSLMWIKNATTSVELMFSLFHGVFETLETVASNVGLGLSQMYNRGMLGGDTSGLVQGMVNIIKSPATPITVANLGSRFREMAGKPDEFWATPEGRAFLAIHPDAREMINALFAGGWKPNEVEADWKNQSVRAFMDSLKDLKEGTSKNYVGAGLRAAPAAAEFMMGPLFDRFIPNLKIGQFVTEMREALRQNWLRYNGRQGYYVDRQGRRYDRPTDTEVARQVWRLIEDRFGELNYDTLFWNQTFKAAMQLMFRSVTWKFGSIEAFGRAAHGQGKEFIDAFKERRAPQLHRNMAWLFGIFLLTAAIGIVISKALGKHTPKNLTDLVFPRIDPHDPSVRVSIPTYFKDLVHLVHSPTGYVKASLAGWIGRVAEMLSNKDYYGVQIRDTDAPATKQALQVGKHAAESLLPFSIRGYRNLSANQENTIRKVGALFGINPAPRYIGQTPAEQQVEKYWKGQRTEEGIKPEQFEIQKGKRELVSKLRHGQSVNIPEALKKGTLKPKDIPALYKRAAMGPLAAGIDKMSLEDAEKVYAKANVAEKRELAGILARKRANALSRSGRTMYTGF